MDEDRAGHFDDESKTALRSRAALCDAMRMEGLEPPRDDAHRDLNAARLPDSATSARRRDSTVRGAADLTTGAGGTIALRAGSGGSAAPR
jgi:hypothetical protein